MRQNGVRAFIRELSDRHHHAEVNVDDQRRHLSVPSFRDRRHYGLFANGSRAVNELTPLFTKAL